MSAPAKSSRWGSFLQQAVAGVEARLDNILAEGENGPSQQAQTSLPATTAAKEQQQQQNGERRVFGSNAFILPWVLLEFSFPDCVTQSLTHPPHSHPPFFNQ